MYHHFLRRAAVVANPVLQTLVQHSQQYKDDPAAPPAIIPTTGQAALAWRLLCNESLRASRDIQLAPHFSLIMSSILSVRLFNLPPAHLFALAAYSENHTLLRQVFPSAMEMLRSPIPFWTEQDLTLQEARSLILALYTPNALSSSQRATLLASMTMKFASPAIILQTLSSIPPTIPLEDMLFELGENLTQDEGTVGAVIERWWGDNDPTEEAGRLVLALCEGMREGRGIDVQGVVKGLCSIVSSPTSPLTIAIYIIC
jgi:CCR4-NOT transcription complex subunit 1